MKIEDELKVVFKSEQHKAAVNIRHTSNVMTHHQNGFMAKYDISMPQFNILRILRGANEPLSVHVVKERMIEKSPNTTRLMDKLIEKGLIERMRCEKDKRILYVSITEEGLNVLSEIDENFTESSIIPSSLTDEEATLLNDLLDKLRTEFLPSK